MATLRDIGMAIQMRIKNVKIFLTIFITVLLLVILASCSKNLRQDGIPPALVLEYGWSPEFKCRIDNIEKKCRAMTIEDIEKLRIWMITVQEGCRWTLEKK